MPLMVIIFVNLLKIIFLGESAEITTCYDNCSSLYSTLDYNRPRVVEVLNGSTVHLLCRYCNAEEDYNPKLWFYRPRGKRFGNITVKEIQPNSNNIDKVCISLSHTLTLHDFNSCISGIYICRSYEKKKEDIIFTYVLDDEEPYNRFKKTYNIILNVYTVWENWSDCREIDGHQKGIRKKLGRCRIGSVTSVSEITKHNSSNTVISYFTDGYDVPCRSEKLAELIPAISKVIRNIPVFELKEVCIISQKPGKHRQTLQKNNKLKITQQVMENSHVILKCNEVLPNSDLKWFKDKTLLRSLYRNILNKREDEPHISIDANNSLHILHITKNEEGNYTCSMNGKQIKQIEVRVVSKSKLLNQEFIRYSIYLGFVLSITMTCYCAGLCVAWHRRASFADPLNLYKRNCNSLKCEQEKLLNNPK
ncbi:uncharacterized protein LOC142973955 isoform X2 [Anticarsia gemmatalis]|uniref:uncharacterized protein LOC142973955 isoform X2 n=1 Tax=Anticarsia gemmatalis TaxID=129554 RepID=UPI003F75D5CE